MNESYTYRNLHAALPNVLSHVLSNGLEQPSRDGHTLECLHTSITLVCPWERFQFHTTRADNPFAKVAETLWVLAGRNDVAWLAQYLPRAPLFSDDGETWRAGYGPRLRRWRNTLDQLATTFDRLRMNLDDRRAVITLWDPLQDATQVASKDFPCNNWLHFLVRDEQLHLAVAVRSNDAWWGWSGINTFEFSVLQEALATWLDVGIGHMTTFASSFHLYQRHWLQAREVVVSGSVDAYGIPTQYTSAARHIPFDIPYYDLDDMLAQFFEAEHAIAAGSLSWYETIESEWLRVCAQMLAVWHALQANRSDTDVDALVSAIPPSDFRVAAAQYVQRKRATVGAQA